jgi:hypothetical protein
METNMKSLWLGGILAGIVVYLWTSVSWMALPFHEKSLLKFTDEAAVTTAIAANIDGPGIYHLPKGHGEAEMKQREKGPAAFVVVRTVGNSSMLSNLAIEFAGTVLASLLIAWLLSRTVGLRYMGKVMLVVTIGLVAGILVLIPEWNWFGFSNAYVGAQFIDLIVGWFLGGLVLAKFSQS